MSAVSVSDSEKSLILKFVEKGIERLEPKVTANGVFYNGLDKPEDWKVFIKTLDNLEKKGLLEGEDFDRAILCPRCDSPHVYSKYACPTDRSIFIRKVVLLRHETDGYSGELQSFIKNDKIVCPKCGNFLGDPEDKSTWDESLKEIGYSFQCDHNRHRFERPLVIHFCPNCGSTFDYKTARYIPLKAYTLTQAAYNMAKSSAYAEQLVKPIIDKLEENDFELVYNIEIRGVSGSIHTFDMVASFGGKRLVFDYSFGESQKLVSLLGKKLDVPGIEAVLIDFSDNEELLNLGKVYNIPIIDTGKQNWPNVLKSVMEKVKQVSAEQEETPRRRLLRRNK